MKLLDLIFPKRCINCRKSGEYICDNCFSYLSFNVKSVCLVCKKASYFSLTHKKCKKKYSIDGCISAISYNNIAKKLIYNFKNKPYITDLQGFLSELFIESIIQNEAFNKLTAKGGWLFVPVPLSASDLRKRGYNQSELLSKALSKKINFKTINILDRKTGSAGKFELKRDIKERIPENTSIFIIDDVVITGETLEQAAMLLKKSGVKQVYGLTFARG